MASFGNNTKKNITKHGNLSLEIKGNVKGHVGS